MLTILPPPLLTISGIAYLLAKYKALTKTAYPLSQSSDSSSVALATLPAQALLTTIASLPYLSCYRNVN